MSRVSAAHRTGGGREGPRTGGASAPTVPEPGRGRPGRIERRQQRLSASREQVRTFRAEGFNERFPAKGQVERVARLNRELLRSAGIPARVSERLGPPPSAEN